MIKSAPQVYIDQILKMFNKILILGHVPRNGVVDLLHQSIKREVNLIQKITGDLCYECLIESFMSDNESGTTSFPHKKVIIPLTEHKQVLCQKVALLITYLP